MQGEKLSHFRLPAADSAKDPETISKSKASPLAKGMDALSVCTHLALEQTKGNSPIPGLPIPCCKCPVM